MKYLGLPFRFGSSSKGVEFSPYYLKKNIEFLNNMNIYKKDNFKKVNNIKEIKKATKNISDFISNKGYNCFIGGDHTISLMILQDGNTDSILWVDSHGDYNTLKTTITGNYHGMVLDLIVNKPYKWINNDIKEKYTCIYGVQNLDKLEEKRIEKSNIKLVRSNEKNNYDLKDIINKLGKNIHVSFDIDSLDPNIAPGVDVKEENGLTMKESKKLFKQINNNQKIKSIDIVEYNPYKDENNKTVNTIKKLLKHLD